MNTTPTLGGDPEFFILEKLKSKYKVITADKILPGKRKKAECCGGHVFFDGVQAEINPRPDTCREFFARNIQDCIEDILSRSSNTKYTKDKTIVFAPLASVPVDDKILKGSDRECFRFGCSPDSNIYTDEKMTYPNGKEFMTRFSGGHVHLGFDDIKYMQTMNTPEKLLNLVRAMDTIAGVMAVAISNGKEEKIRRQYYGKAGTYRLQKHGIEYRTLSSFWLVSPPLTSLMVGLIRDAFTIVYKGVEQALFKYASTELIRDIIDNSKVNKAKKFYYDEIIPFYDTYSIANSPLNFTRDVVDNMIENGYRTYFCPYHMLNYWNLKKPWLVNPNEHTPSYFGINNLAENLNEDLLDDIKES